MRGFLITLRYKVILEYDGTGFSGWQRQDHVITVQEVFEKAILDFSQEKVLTQASGRTDAGVHARGQVVHFDLKKDFPTHNVQNGINFYLKNHNISVLNTEIVNNDFNARFSAKKRFYRYDIINRSSPLAIDKNRAWLVHEELDIAAMQHAANYLIGKHDFTSFRASACQANSPIRTIDSITIERNKDRIYISISAQSFLHHMVRNITGTLKYIGCGKWQPEIIQEILSAKNRRAAGSTAPACGLYFIKVEY